MISIEFPSDGDACLVLKALPAELQASAYFRPAVGGVIGSPPRLFVKAEHEAAVSALAVDLASARRVMLLNYAAEQRWRRETSGMTVAGVPILTDDRSKLMIAGARLAATAKPDWTTPWHGADGGTYVLDAAMIVAISDAVSAHVQASFATFATVKAAIASGTITTTAEIDAAFGFAA
jgi:hypothetical protein